MWVLDPRKKVKKWGLLDMWVQDPRKKVKKWGARVCDSCCSQNACPETRTPSLPGSDTICRILHPIEVSLIPKQIGDKKWHNNSFMVRVRARQRLWLLRSKGGHWPQHAFTNIVTNNGLFFCVCLYVRPSTFSQPYTSTILIIGQIGPFFHQNQQSKRQTCHYLTPICNKQCLPNRITLTKYLAIFSII